MQRVGLQPARYIEAAAYRTISRYETPHHDISISLLGYDVITTINNGKVSLLVLLFAFSTLTMLVGWQEGHLACKN